jgi:3',5'-cyclic-AMP phosphodiesterase
MIQEPLKMTLRIALIGDIHYPTLASQPKHIQARDEFFRHVFQEFFSLDADVYICVGDVTHTGHADEWNGIANLLEPYEGKPFRFVLGNHDTLVETKASVLSRMHQSRYFTEDFGDVRLMFIDTTHERRRDNWGGVVDKHQLDWIRSEENHMDTPLLLFGHHPLYNTTAHSSDRMMYIENSAELEAAVDRAHRPVIYFNGHNHAQSIVKHPGRENWTCIQTASILSGLCFRTIDVNVHRDATSIKIETRSIDTMAVESSRSVLYEAITDYWHNPLAMGEPADQSMTQTYEAPRLR